MKMRVTRADIDELLYESCLPGTDCRDNAVSERTFRLDHRMGKVHFEETWFNGILMSKGEIKLHQDLELKAFHSEPVVEMHFCLTGSSEVSVGKTGKKFSFGDREHNLYYRPSFEETLSITAQNRPSHYFEVHFMESYFRTLMEPDGVPMARFLRDMEKKQFSSVVARNMPITTRMQALIGEMAACNKKGSMKRLFLESRLLELLMLQTEQLNTDRLSERKLKGSDLEKLRQVRYLLDQDLGHAHSLAELCKNTGLNDFKLKKGFKQLFGTTVFGYLHERRMEEALRLLTDEQKSIAEVSDYCGYDYPHHFAMAFKKKFGITPGKVKADAGWLTPGEDGFPVFF